MFFIGSFSGYRDFINTSKSDMMGLRYAPYCFTEQGVTMLSCVLNRKRAIEVNIKISGQDNNT